MKMCKGLLFASVLLVSSSFGLRAVDVVVGVSHAQGPRSAMEDAEMVYQSGKTRVFGVFDGHAGDSTAKYAAEHMGEAIVDDEAFAQNKEQAIRNAFRNVDQECCNLPEGYVRGLGLTRSGATAIVAVVDDENNLYIANAGDARIVVAGKKEVIAQTDDHKPSVPSEQERIKLAGGYVVDGRVMGVLAVSRALGDPDYKENGVTSDPDIKSMKIDKDYEFMIIACDGLWDVMTSDVARQVVVQQMEREGVTPQTMTQKEADLIAQRLVNRALTGHVDYPYVSFLDHSVVNALKEGKIKKEDVNWMDNVEIDKIDITKDQLPVIKKSQDNVTAMAVFFKHSEDQKPVAISIQKVEDQKPVAEVQIPKYREGLKIQCYQLERASVVELKRALKEYKARLLNSDEPLSKGSSSNCLSEIGRIEVELTKRNVAFVGMSKVCAQNYSMNFMILATHDFWKRMSIGDAQLFVDARLKDLKLEKTPWKVSQAQANQIAEGLVQQVVMNTPAIDDYQGTLIARIIFFSQHREKAQVQGMSNVLDVPGKFEVLAPWFGFWQRKNVDEVNAFVTRKIEVGEKINKNRADALAEELAKGVEVMDTFYATPKECQNIVSIVFFNNQEEPEQSSEFALID